MCYISLPDLIQIRLTESHLFIIFSFLVGKVKVENIFLFHIESLIRFAHGKKSHGEENLKFISFLKPGFH